MRGRRGEIYLPTIRQPNSGFDSDRCLADEYPAGPWASFDKSQLKGVRRTLISLVIAKLASMFIDTTPW
jgi:hypothetical protein